MYLKIKAEPAAKKDEIKKLSSDTFLVRVKAKAEKNQANKRISELLATYLNIPSGQVRLVAGHHSHSKIFSIPDGPNAPTLSV